MIEIRETTQKEKAKHSNMAYVIDLGHTKQWFTEKALVELLDKLHKVVNENGLLQRVSIAKRTVYCECSQRSLMKPISPTEYECFDCGKEVKQ